MNFSFYGPRKGRQLRSANLRYIISGNTPVKISESEYIAEKHNLILVSQRENGNNQTVYTYKRKKKGA
jgi:hypothetical protein